MHLTAKPNCGIQCKCSNPPAEQKKLLTLLQMYTQMYTYTLEKEIFKQGEKTFSDTIVKMKYV